MLDAARLSATGLPADEALRLASALADAPPAPTRWAHAAALLHPTHPWETHELLWEWAWSGWDEGRRGPRLAWQPDAAVCADTNAGDWARLHDLSVNDPEAFWRRVFEAQGLRFDVPPLRILDRSGGAEHPRWLPGASFNIADLALTGDDRPAIVHAREGGQLERVSRRQLRSEALLVAGALERAGLAGKPVAIDMPMHADSVRLYLGVVLAGGSVVSIADSFAAPEIATRLEIGEASAIFSQHTIRRGGRALALHERVVDAEAPPAIVIPDPQSADPRAGLRPQDRTLAQFLAGASPLSEPVLAGPEQVTNVLFSSGTTGAPKAIPWTQVTPLKAGGDGWAHHDIRPGDVVAWPTNLGWMMGPWLIYASLLNGASMALFDGLPSGSEFCRFVQDAEVTMLGVVPSLVAAWRHTDAAADCDWSRIRAFSSTGEASRADDMRWLMSRAGYRPVVEYCGGTEIGGGYICGAVAQPQAPACFSTEAIGCRLLLLDDQGQPGKQGEVALVPPMLGSSQRLLNRDHHATYFEGMPAGPNGEVLRRHGDAMERLPGGFFRALGRIDDTMNLGGIKTSSAELERACSEVEGIAQVAAVAVPPPGGGPDRLILYVVGAQRPTLRTELQRAIRTGLNPLFKVHAVVMLEALPRTASGKVMRRVLRRRWQDTEATSA